MFFLKHFSSYYQNAYGHKTCQGGDILQRALTINLHDALMRGSCEVTWQMKYISPLSCRIPVNTKLRKVLTYCKRLSPLKPHDSDHVSKMRSRENFGKIYISIFTRFMATKLGRVLTSGRRFSTQTIKSSPTSCFYEQCIPFLGSQWWMS